MRYFPRLPPLLRVASILALLFLLAGVGLWIADHVTGVPTAWDSLRVHAMEMNLVLLSLACTLVVNGYSARFWRPDGGPFPFSSWPSQVQALALLSALPLGGIAVALLLPPTPLAFWVVSLIPLLTALVLLVATMAFVAGPASSGAMRTPPTG